MRTAMIVALSLLAGVAGTATAGGVPLVDASGGSHGSANVSLTKGSVKLKVTGLPRLPAAAPLGAGFDAYVYKAYLVSSADPGVEVYLADIFPSSSGAAKVKVAPKGDVSALGLDRLVVTAYSKDARGSFDVLTAALP
jgi:hypothetical protein